MESTIQDEFAVTETTIQTTDERVFLVSHLGEFLEGFTVKKLVGLLEDMDMAILNKASDAERNPTQDEQSDMDALRCTVAIIKHLTK